MPRSVRSVGLFCWYALGSIVAWVSYPNVAWAETAPAAVSAQSNPTSATTAKSATTQSPSPSTALTETAPPPATTSPEVSLPPVAPAPSAEEVAAAREALAAGQAAYTSGDYVSAEGHFRASLERAPTAAAQYGLAMTLDLEAKPAEAFAAFQTLFGMPDFATLPADQAEAAKQRFAVLQTIPAAVVVIVNAPGAQLEVDGTPQTGESPFTLRLAAGKHTIRATAAEYEPGTSEVEVKPAEQREVSLTLSQLPKPAPVPPSMITTEAAPASAPPSKVPAYVTLGVAGAAAITGGIFGIRALGAKSDFDKSPTIAHADSVERNALIADMAFGIAFTLGITGAVLLFTDEPTDPAADPDTQTALQLVPYVSRTSGGAAARMTW